MMLATSNAIAPPPDRRPSPAAIALPAFVPVQRAVIVREVRQNSATLALAVAVACIVVCLTEWLRSGDNPLISLALNDSHYNVLVNPALRSALLIESLFVGLLIGLLQPLSDRHSNLWAFLNHRPVPRWWLFFGRLVAGTILYGIGAVLPVLILMALSTTRWGGRFFIWELWLQPAVNCAAGYSLYVAGLLTMQRQGRWYGSRAVPLVLAVMAWMLVQELWTFWSCMTVIAAVSVLYTIAAAGAYVSRGFVLSAPRITRLALYTVVYLGFATLVVLGLLYPLSRVSQQRMRLAFNSYQRTSPWWEHPETVYTSRSIDVTANGQITRVTSVFGWDPKVGHAITLLHERVDLLENPVREPTEQEEFAASANRISFFGRGLSRPASSLYAPEAVESFSASDGGAGSMCGTGCHPAACCTCIGSPEYLMAICRTCDIQPGGHGSTSGAWGPMAWFPRASRCRSMRRTSITHGALALLSARRQFSIASIPLTQQSARGSLRRQGRPLRPSLPIS